MIRSTRRPLYAIPIFFEICIKIVSIFWNEILSKMSLTFCISNEVLSMWSFVRNLTFVPFKLFLMELNLEMILLRSLFLRNRAHLKIKRIDEFKMMMLMIMTWWHMMTTQKTAQKLMKWHVFCSRWENDFSQQFPSFNLRTKW